MSTFLDQAGFVDDADPVMTVQLDESLPPGALLNRLEVWEWPEVDVDPIPENNTFVYPIELPGTRVFLPLILKH